MFKKLRIIKHFENIREMQGDAHWLSKKEAARNRSIFSYSKVMTGVYRHAASLRPCLCPTLHHDTQHPLLGYFIQSKTAVHAELQKNTMFL